MGSLPSLRLSLVRPHLVHVHPLVDRLLEAALLLHRNMLLLLLLDHGGLLRVQLLLTRMLLLLIKTSSVPQTPKSEKRKLKS